MFFLRTTIFLFSFLLTYTINASENHFPFSSDVSIPRDLAEKIVFEHILADEAPLKGFTELIFDKQKSPCTYFPSCVMPLVLTNTACMNFLRKNIIIYLEHILPEILKKGLQKHHPRSFYYPLLYTVIEALSLTNILSAYIEQKKIKIEHCDGMVDILYAECQWIIQQEPNFALPSGFASKDAIKDTSMRSLKDAENVMLTIIFIKLFKEFHDTAFHRSIIAIVLSYIYNETKKSNYGKDFETFKMSAAYKETEKVAASFWHSIEQYNPFLKKYFPQHPMHVGIPIGEQLKEYFFHALYESFCGGAHSVSDCFELFPFFTFRTYPENLIALKKRIEAAICMKAR